MPRTAKEYAEIVARDIKIRELQQENSVMKQALEEYGENGKLLAQVAELLREEITPWDPKPLAFSPSPSAKFEVDAAVSLSDEHADEVISGPATWGLERYNFDVFRIRLQRWAKVTIAYLTEHLPRYKFERVWIQKLGDGQHGNLHLPGQKYRNHFANDIRAAIAIGEAEADAIALVGQAVPQVIVTCISGNHPRQTVKKDYGDPHDNLDFLIATVIELRLRKYAEEGRVTVLAPRSWSAYQDIRGWVNALNHGDDVIGTWSIPWYGFSKHEARVQAAVATAGQRIDYFWYGHYHTDVGVSENGARAIHAGAFTRTDDYVINKMKAFHEPTQIMEVFDDPLGRIIEVPLFVRDEKRESAYWDGNYVPEIGRDSALTTLGAIDELAAKGGFPLITAPAIGGKQ